MLASITPSAVISSAPDGPNFDYTIALTNSSSSDSGIGTFWYSWIPGQDYLATSPISVSPPAGWTDNITNMGSGDGFAIEFIANGPANDVQPGSSLNFSFTSADSPASVNGNSVFFPGTPVDTSFVYPQGPFSDAGHQFVVTSASSPAPTPTPSPTPSPSATATAPVTITGVRVVQKKHKVAEIIVDFSGRVNAAAAENLADFQLTTMGKKGSFTGKGAKAVALKSATYVDAAHEVTLLSRKAFAVTKPVQLIIDGQSPGGLQDTSGGFIDGGNTGHGGDNGVFVISRGGVSRG